MTNMQFGKIRKSNWNFAFCRLQVSHSVLCFFSLYTCHFPKNKMEQDGWPTTELMKATNKGNPKATSIAGAVVIILSWLELLKSWPQHLCVRDNIIMGIKPCFGKENDVPDLWDYCWQSPTPWLFTERKQLRSHPFTVSLALLVKRRQTRGRIFSRIPLFR